MYNLPTTTRPPRKPGRVWYRATRTHRWGLWELGIKRKQLWLKSVEGEWAEPVKNLEGEWAR